MEAELVSSLESDSNKILSMTRPPPNEVGTVGKPFLLCSNHFKVDLNNTDLHKYNVTFEPDAPHSHKQALMSRLVHKNKFEKHVAFDSRFKTIITNGELSFSYKKFQMPYLIESDGTQQSSIKEYSVFVKYCEEFQCFSALLKSLKADVENVDLPDPILQGLNLVLHQGHYQDTRYQRQDRAFYSYNKAPRMEIPGVKFFSGFFQSIHHTQMGLSLNVDKCTFGFLSDGPLIAVLSSFLGKTLSNEDLDNDTYLKINDLLKNKLIRASYGEVSSKLFFVLGLSSRPADEITFHNDKEKTIPLYYKTVHNAELSYTRLPCLIAVDKRRIPLLLPMELCSIVEGQQGRQAEKHEVLSVSDMKMQPPNLRQITIANAVKESSYGNDPHAREFGITVSDSFARVHARLLPGPALMFGDNQTNYPESGKWTMDGKRLYDAGSVQKWFCIIFSKVTAIRASDFCDELVKTCQKLGMNFRDKPMFPPFVADPDKVGEELQRLHGEFQWIGKKLDLLVAILPDSHVSVYGELKRVCETELGITSQCIKSKTLHAVLENRGRLPLPGRHYLESMACQINAKVGGKSYVLARAHLEEIPGISSKRTIIFGSDVTHYKKHSSPSIASVVASQDWPDIVQYAGVVRAQKAGQEIILELQYMIKELLMSFIAANENQKPERIIFYRDGVGNSEFSDVIAKEIKAIKRACDSICPGYKPLITFLVVQKRHHTRLFSCEGVSDRGFFGADRNVLPGTVVDSDICRPQYFDFYLCSHTANKGTVRPAHYTVLCNENDFSADEIQCLTNDLCHTSARCTSSISIVPPIHYAHLAASRARSYWQVDSDALPELKENVKKMFYI